MHSASSLFSLGSVARLGQRAAGTVCLCAALGPAAADAGPQGVIGVDFMPLGRADLAWTPEDRLSGVLGNEEDGFVQGPLRLLGGSSRNARQIVLVVVLISSSYRSEVESDSGGDDIVRGGSLKSQIIDNALRRMKQT